MGVCEKVEDFTEKLNKLTAVAFTDGKYCHLHLFKSSNLYIQRN